MDEEMFKSKLANLADVNSQMSVSASMAITKSEKANPEMRRVISEQIDVILDKAWFLQRDLDEIAREW